MIRRPPKKRDCKKYLALLGGCYLFVSAAAEAQSPARAEEDASIADCDRYAASDLDEPKSGIPFEKIDPKFAIPACEEAVRTHPSSARLIFELGRSYSKSGDFAAALVRFRQGAEQGYPPALNSMGAMYANGSGVPKDEVEAVNWYRKSAERGYIGGQLNLGFMYENGHGVAQDYAAAFYWYGKAAAQGSALGQDSIGYFYAKGMGVKMDDTEAVAWFRKAAEQGMAGAQYNLGFVYEKGLGVLQDRSEAFAWYRRSANQGYENAEKALLGIAIEDAANGETSVQNPVASTATEPLIAKLAEANDAVKDVAPRFGCYDQTNPKTCQQTRMAVRSGGTFYVFDFANGSHIQCFSPGFDLPYRVCSGDVWRTDIWLWPEIYNGNHWVRAPFADARCDHWGGPFTAEYLACEASLPPKTE